MTCTRKETNLSRCNCSYPGCSRKGNCCECLAYHLSAKELPACAFPNNAEATYDRSFSHFAKLMNSGQI